MWSPLKALTRSVGKERHRSIAHQVMKNARIKEHVLQIATHSIKKDLCARKTCSILRNATPQAVQTFTWEALVSLQLHAPTLFWILNGCVQVKRRVRVLKKASAKERVRKRGSNLICRVCVCCYSAEVQKCPHEFGPTSNISIAE